VSKEVNPSKPNEIKRAFVGQKQVLHKMAGINFGEKFLREA